MNIQLYYYDLENAKLRLRVFKHYLLFLLPEDNVIEGMQLNQYKLA